MVDVEKCFIQIKQGPGNSVQVLPLNMVNMLHPILEESYMIGENHQEKTLRL
jgi:hypothetical protein